MRAMWNGTVIAQSDDTVVVEGNHYFARFDALATRWRAALRDDVVRPSDTHTVCPWKGTASYYSLEVDGQVNPDAVWYYPDPKPKAAMVADRVAFWKGVVVSE